MESPRTARGDRQRGRKCAQDILLVSMRVQDVCPPRHEMATNLGKQAYTTEAALGKDGHRHAGLAQSFGQQSFIQENDVDNDVIRAMQGQHQIV